MKKQLLCLALVSFMSLSLNAQNDKKTETLRQEDKNFKVQSSEVKVKTQSDGVQEKSSISHDNLKKQESADKLERKNLPQDFPKFESTGDPEKDKASYIQRKEKWIQENPEEYKAMFDKSSGEVKRSGDRSKPHAVKVVKSK